MPHVAIDGFLQTAADRIGLMESGKEQNVNACSAMRWEDRADKK